MEKIWTCKIGECDNSILPDGADLPMREAVEKVYFDLTGEQPTFLFSGWGGELDEFERKVVDNEKRRYGMRTFSGEEGKLFCAVNEFTSKMRKKLQQKKEEGFTGWDDPAWPDEDIIGKIKKNLLSGDMVDVANLAMFLWNKKIGRAHV